MSGKRGSTVYIGSGLCSDLDFYLEMAPERLYLVEPNPRLKDDLDEICAVHPSVEHLAYGVTVHGGKKKLNVFNYFDLSSFSEPEKLYEVYPGIALESTPEVQTLSPEELLARLDLPENRSNLLVIEATGIERDLLEAFISSGAYQQFSELSLRMPVRDLFKGSSSLSQIEALLEAAGCRIVEQIEISNADWHHRSYSFDRQLFKTNNLIQENESLRADQARLHQSLEAEHQINQILRSKAEQEKVQFEQEAQELRSKCEQADKKSAEAQRAIQDLNSQLEKEKVRLSEKLEMSLRVQARLLANFEDLQRRFDEIEATNHELDSLISELVEELEKNLMNIIQSPKDTASGGGPKGRKR